MTNGNNQHETPSETFGSAQLKKSGLYAKNGGILTNIKISVKRESIAEKYRDIYEKQARENQLNALKQNQNTVLPNSVKRESIDTTKKLAEVANVGKETYRMGAKILNSDDEDFKKNQGSQNSPKVENQVLITLHQKWWDKAYGKFTTSFSNLCGTKRI